nr:TBC1 domain family member 5 [Cryptococcus depauperatus CBS 7841]
MGTHPPLEQDVFIRPTSNEIRAAWDSLFSDPLVSISKLRSKALDKAGLGVSASEGGVTLRSVYWRFYHTLLPPPTSLDLFLPSLEASREAYHAIRRRYLVAPDGRWASDCSGFNKMLSSPTLSSPNPNATESATPIPQQEGWDPLSLSTSSPWNTWFAHTELRAMIRKDVERTFPDMPYFQLERVQRCMTTALFLFSVLNPDVGYRQGMHELFACCFLAVDRDTLDTCDKAPKGEREIAMSATLNREYIEHDAFELFGAIMKSAKVFYEWRAEEVPIRSKSSQAPIILRCDNLHSSLLRRVDPQLWESLENEGVEPQIWAVRWIRLMLTRELPFDVAMRIWDGVFAEDPGLHLLDFICIAMLLLIRNTIIGADYPMMLTNLLHYPSPSQSYPFETSLILTQAINLRSNISPAAGVEIVIQNQDLLGIKIAGVDDEQDNMTSHGTHSRLSGRSGIREESTILIGPTKPRVQKGGVGGLAQGLFERAQAAGLDKAFMATVNDLKRSLPDSATAYSYLPNLPFSPSSPGFRTPSDSFSTIPEHTLALPSRSSFYSQSSPSGFSALVSHSPIHSQTLVESQPFEDSTKTIKDAEREMAELRLAMLGMGKAIKEWIIVLRKPENADDSEVENAWKGIERVRDTLLDVAGKSVDDIVKEWGWHEGLEAPISQSPPPALAATSSCNVPPVSNQNKRSSRPCQLPTTGPMPMDFEDTPTPTSVSIIPNTPLFPGISRSGLSSSQNTFYQESQLNLSSQNDNSLMNPTKRSQSATSNINNIGSVQAEGSMVPARADIGFVPIEKDEDAYILERLAADNVSDPLAGLGVIRHKDKRTFSGKSVVDPLMGIGVK